MRTQAARPRFLDFRRIRFPVGAIASIAHRVSGILLVCVLPFAALAAEWSLRSEAAFESLFGALPSPAGRVALALLVTAAAYAHARLT